MMHMVKQEYINDAIAYVKEFMYGNRAYEAIRNYSVAQSLKK